MLIQPRDRYYVFLLLFNLEGVINAVVKELLFFLLITLSFAKSSTLASFVG